MVSEPKFALVLCNLDNLVLDNRERKKAAYLELGWDEKSIDEFLSKKENAEKIASFNTPTVSFTASSRINKYFNIYNRPDMLEKDRPYPGAVEALKTLMNTFKIFIISERNEDLREQTVKVMKKLSFPMEYIDIKFKKSHQKVNTYKMHELIDIKAGYPGGIAVINRPEESQMIRKFGYQIIGFPSIHDWRAFEGKTDAIFGSWDEITRAISEQ